MRLFKSKIFVVLSIVLCTSPFIFAPYMVNALNENQPTDALSINAGARMLLNVEGELEIGFSENEHLVYMEAGKEYVFRVTFDPNCEGLYHMRINYVGEIYGFAQEFDTYNSGDVGRTNKTLEFTVITPDNETGDHNLIVGNGSFADAATYTLYFKSTEPITYWWIYAIAGGGLVVLIIIIVVIAVSVRKKKGKKKKTTKKKKK